MERGKRNWGEEGNDKYNTYYSGKHGHKIIIHIAFTTNIDDFVTQILKHGRNYSKEP